MITLSIHLVIVYKMYSSMKSWPRLCLPRNKIGKKAMVLNKVSVSPDAKPILHSLSSSGQRLPVCAARAKEVWRSLFTMYKAAAEFARKQLKQKSQ